MLSLVLHFGVEGMIGISSQLKTLAVRKALKSTICAAVEFVQPVLDIRWEKSRSLHGTAGRVRFRFALWKTFPGRSTELADPSTARRDGSASPGMLHLGASVDRVTIEWELSSGYQYRTFVRLPLVTKDLGERTDFD